MRNGLLTGMLLLALSAQATAASRERSLDQWLDRDALPFVKKQLLEHPRFKGETVMFVILEDNATATSSNELALSLRDRLLDAALDTPGVTIGWRQGRADAHHGTEAIDCTRDDVHYYIGLEISQQLDDSYSVRLRALDLEERTWVSGFGKSWRGNLSMAQRRALRASKVDDTFLGARDVPFTIGQNDLLAKHLAHELSCVLLRETSGDYVVPARQPANSAEEPDNTIELVSNNIAANSAIELSTSAELVNARISGKAHQIDGTLFEYWLTVTPTEEDSELASLSVSAYLLRPDTRFRSVARNRPDALIAESALPVRTTITMPNNQRGSLIGRTSFADDAVVFFIEHRPYFGLVRLDNGVCRNRTMAKVVRAGDPLRFPLVYTHSRNSETIETDEWLVAPLRDTYYAIAISDERTARRIANHLDQLPIRCGASTISGLTGQALRAWLDEFSSLAAGSAQHIDWRAIEIRNVL